jgi:hypothetical protein
MIRSFLTTTDPEWLLLIGLGLVGIGALGLMIWLGASLITAIVREVKRKRRRQRL